MLFHAQAVGRVLDSMDRHGYGKNTLTWLATDNGPEVNCPPEGVSEHGMCHTSMHVHANVRTHIDT